jgi:hypothetical protein
MTEAYNLTISSIYMAASVLIVLIVATMLILLHVWSIGMRILGRCRMVIRDPFTDLLHVWSMGMRNKLAFNNTDNLSALRERAQRGRARADADSEYAQQPKQKVRFHILHALSCKIYSSLGPSGFLLFPLLLARRTLASMGYTVVQRARNPRIKITRARTPAYAHRDRSTPLSCLKYFMIHTAIHILALTLIRCAA